MTPLDYVLIGFCLGVIVMFFLIVAAIAPKRRG